MEHKDTTNLAATLIALRTNLGMTDSIDPAATHYKTGDKSAAYSVELVMGDSRMVRVFYLPLGTQLTDARLRCLPLVVETINTMHDHMCMALHDLDIVGRRLLAQEQGANGDATYN